MCISAFSLIMHCCLCDCFVSAHTNESANKFLVCDSEELKPEKTKTSQSPDVCVDKGHHSKTKILKGQLLYCVINMNISNINISLHFKHFGEILIQRKFCVTGVMCLIN